MKPLLAAFGALTVLTGLATGQGIALKIDLDQEQYLPGESLVIKVRISNYSGQLLQMGTDDQWLSLTVEDSHHNPVPKLTSLPVKGQFSLEPSMTATKKVDLAPSFDLTRTGRYYVTASLALPQWRESFQTKPVSVDIIKGNSIWEQEFGVPDSANGPDGRPEMRRYALIQTLHSKKLKLYFRLTDTRDMRIFRIYPLGDMVSFSNPEPQLDRFNNLHVLYQTGGRSFLHCLMNPDGLLLARESYEYSSTRPTLHAEKDGRISVAGGTRRLEPTDLPPISSSTTPPNAKPDQP